MRLRGFRGLRFGDGHLTGLVEGRREVAVVGASPNPDKKGRYVIVGRTCSGSYGGTRHVVVRIDGDTTIGNDTGERFPATALVELTQGSKIIVDGRKNKRGVIRAKAVVMV